MSKTHLNVTATSADNRKVVLLRAALDMLEKLSNSPVVISPAETTVEYDGTDCDGLCLIDDIRIELGH